MTKITGHRNCRGSLSLEAAMVMPLLLVFAISLLALLQCSVCEIKFKNALDRTAAEISLLSPMIFLADEIGSFNLINQLLEEILPGQSDETLFADLALDLSTSVLLGPFIQNRMDFWLAEACSGQPGWQSRLGARRLYLDWQVADHRLWLIFDYEIMTPLGRFQRKACAVVPLWTGQLEQQSCTGDDSVWMMDNFARGRKIRQVFGANLPDNFPVIASFAAGQALMIRSVDLTAPTYQEQDRTLASLQQMVDELAAFNGASVVRSDQRIDVQAADIDQKSILLVIPSNTDQPWLHHLLAEFCHYAAARQITIRVERYGSSYRYSQDGQDQLVTSAGLRYHFNVAA